MRIVTVVVLIVATLLAGCAATQAGADAGLASRSQAGGVFAADRVDIRELKIEVGSWPAGMEGWTAEQITAFVRARAGASPMELFAARGGDVHGQSDQASKSGDATQTTETDANLDNAGGTIAGRLGRALGAAASGAAGGSKEGAGTGGTGGTENGAGAGSGGGQ